MSDQVREELICSLLPAVWIALRKCRVPPYLKADAKATALMWLVSIADEIMTGKIQDPRAYAYIQVRKVVSNYIYREHVRSSARRKLRAKLQPSPWKARDSELLLKLFSLARTTAERRLLVLLMLDHSQHEAAVRMHVADNTVSRMLARMRGRWRGELR